MTLGHQLIGIVAVLPWALLVAEVIRRTEAPWTGIAAAAVGLVSVLPLCWGICRILRHPPLFIFASPCPTCGVKPGFYGINLEDWPRARLVCPLCATALELWMSRHVKPELISPDTPTYCLRWPEFVGRWRRIA